MDDPYNVKTNYIIKFFGEVIVHWSYTYIIIHFALTTFPHTTIICDTVGNPVKCEDRNL